MQRRQHGYSRGQWLGLMVFGLSLPVLLLIMTQRERVVTTLPWTTDLQAATLEHEQSARPLFIVIDRPGPCVLCLDPAVQDLYQHELIDLIERDFVPVVVNRAASLRSIGIMIDQPGEQPLIVTQRGGGTVVIYDTQHAMESAALLARLRDVIESLAELEAQAVRTVSRPHIG